MRSMPTVIKNKIRQLQKANQKANELSRELESIFEEYGIKTDLLCGNGNIEQVQTEALSFVNYAEGDVEDNILEIEKIFLYYINQNQM